jgi:hypothetical protein
MSSETCRAYLYLLINTILPEFHLVGLLYIIDINFIEERKVLFVKYVKSRERERAKEAVQHQCQKKTNTVVENTRTRKVSEMLTVKGCGTECVRNINTCGL